jgi:hypothetical protein
MVSEVAPIVFEGRLAALAGPTRCHVLCRDLADHELRIVLLMCLFTRFAIDRGHDLSTISRHAEAWARLTDEACRRPDRR